VRYGHTEIHPFALVLTLAMGVAMLMVHRDRAALPLLVVACFVTHVQRLVIGGMDFSMLRLMILFGWARLLFRSETKDYRYHTLDGVLLVWLSCANLAYVFGPRASVDNFILRLGLTFDAVGIYFLFRILLRDVRDVQRTLGAFGWIAVGLTLPMLLENLTGRNIFSPLGVPEITRIRDGRLRCQGPFSHPITAGNFGATTAALLMALWLGYPKERVLRTIQLLGAGAITILSASSGPLFALIGAGLGWGLWPYRRHLRAIRWGTFLSLVVIHFAREKPVWHLIGRVSQLTGGTGWHRYRLIDEWVAHFHEWWFLGARTTQHWGIPQAADVTNQYVIEGVRGGLPTLLSFVALLAIGFRTVGRAVRRIAPSRRMDSAERRRAASMSYGLGVCLFSHAVGFIGVSYFGQMMSIFYLHLAMIPSMAMAAARRERQAGAAARRRAAPRPAAPAPSAVRSRG
jgi:hypothetical protein